MTVCVCVPRTESTCALNPHYQGTLVTAVCINYSRNESSCVTATFRHRLRGERATPHIHSHTSSPAGLPLMTAGGLFILTAALLSSGTKSGSRVAQSSRWKGSQWKFPATSFQLVLSAFCWSAAGLEMTACVILIRLAFGRASPADCGWKSHKQHRWLGRNGRQRTLGRQGEMEGGWKELRCCHRSGHWCRRLTKTMRNLWKLDLFPCSYLKRVWYKLPIPTLCSYYLHLYPCLRLLHCAISSSSASCYSAKPKIVFLLPPCGLSSSCRDPLHLKLSWCFKSQQIEYINSLDSKNSQK